MRLPASRVQLIAGHRPQLKLSIGQNMGRQCRHTNKNPLLAPFAGSTPSALLGENQLVNLVKSGKDDNDSQAEPKHLPLKDHCSWPRSSR